MYKKPELKSYSASDVAEKIGPCQNQYTTTFYTTTGNSNVNVDGYMRSNFVISDSYVSAGDVSDDVTYYRGFFGFDISSIQNRTIVSATLRIYQWNADALAYAGLGSMLVDHVNFGNSLGTEDFPDGAALSSNIGTISSNTTVEWKTLGVGTYVQADLNAGRTSSQYRIRFTTNIDPDGAQDAAFFESVENSGGTGNRPELVVTYN